MEQMEIDLAKQRENAETTLETLKRKDSELRRKLEESYPDDQQFSALAKEMRDYLEKAASPCPDGIEKARALAAAKAVMEKMLQTERGKLSAEFMSVSEKREAAEEEVRTLKGTSENR